MPPQVSKDEFVSALCEMGHDPKDYEGKRLTLSGMCELYELKQDSVLEAIDRRQLSAHYDYFADTIWIDALEAAHFYFCIKNEAHLYSS